MGRLPPRPALAALLLLGGCAAAPPRPTSAEHGLLVARVKVRGALLRRTSDIADAGVLVKLGNDGRPQDGAFAVSRYAKDGYFYFLDLIPGRYVLVSASFPARGTRYRVVMPDYDMAKRMVELKAGEAAFLGDYELDGRFPDFPEAVDRAASNIGRLLTFFLRHAPMPRDTDFRALDRSPQAEGRAFLSARESLKGTEWDPLALLRLRSLGTPEPAATAGLLRSKPLPLKPEAMFSWRDVLGWGEPLRTARGVEWRDPAGGARAAVWYTPNAARGFQGWDAAVRELRAGAAVDGPSRLEEVKVATRTALAGRSSRWVYPESSLVGSEQRVLVTETVLVPDGEGLYTARLRAEKSEFERTRPAFRRLLEQLVLGPPAPETGPKRETSSAP